MVDASTDRGKNQDDANPLYGSAGGDGHSFLAFYSDPVATVLTTAHLSSILELKFPARGLYTSHRRGIFLCLTGRKTRHKILVMSTSIFFYLKEEKLFFPC